MEKLILVEWEDSFGCPSGWEFEDEVEVRTTTVRTVGWLVRETEGALLVVPHLSAPGHGRRQFAGYIGIPKRQIVSWREIDLTSSSGPSCLQPE